MVLVVAGGWLLVAAIAVGVLRELRGRTVDDDVLLLFWPLAIIVLAFVGGFLALTWVGRAPIKLCVYLIDSVREARRAKLPVAKVNEPRPR